MSGARGSGALGLSKWSGPVGPPNRCLSEHVDTAELATSKQELGRLASSQHVLPASTQAKTNKELNQRRNRLATSVQRIARKVRTHPLRLQVPWKKSSQGLAKSKETVSLILWTLCLVPPSLRSRESSGLMSKEHHACFCRMACHADLRRIRSDM